VSADPERWHLITGEYPPGVGGVAAFSREIAEGLGAAGRDVHVWCPATGAEAPTTSVTVHRLTRAWTPEGIAEADRALDRFPRPRRLFVQWVPHAYGARSLNLAFCRWLRRRAAGGDTLQVMVHEPFLPFEHGLRQRTAALIHRWMIRTVFAGASRVWVSIPAWQDRITPYLPEGLSSEWLPVPSSVPVAEAGTAVSAVRAARLAPGTQVLAGHFGTFSRETRPLLDQAIARVLDRSNNVTIVCFGRGSDEYVAAAFGVGPSGSGRENRGNRHRVVSAGLLADRDASLHLQACDVMIQPYVDGASARRTTLMAALAHGRAIVTTIGPLSEAWWTMTNAVLAVDVASPDSLGDAALTLAADATRRTEAGIRARVFYDERFAVRHAIARLVASEGSAG
jgi:glycosyltransferase involved in cell wall biosynthesis